LAQVQAIRNHNVAVGTAPPAKEAPPADCDWRQREEQVPLFLRWHAHLNFDSLVALAIPKQKQFGKQQELNSRLTTCKRGSCCGLAPWCGGAWSLTHKRKPNGQLRTPQPMRRPLLCPLVPISTTMITAIIPGRPLSPSNPSAPCFRSCANAR